MVGGGEGRESCRFVFVFLSFHSFPRICRLDLCCSRERITSDTAEPINAHARTRARSRRLRSPSRIECRGAEVRKKRTVVIDSYPLSVKNEAPPPYFVAGSNSVQFLTLTSEQVLDRLSVNHMI